MEMENEIEVVVPWPPHGGMAIATLRVLLGKVPMEQQLHSLVDGTCPALAVGSRIASDNLT